MLQTNANTILKNIISKLQEAVFAWNKNLNGKNILWFKDYFSINKVLCSTNQLSQYVLTQDINFM